MKNKKLTQKQKIKNERIIKLKIMWNQLKRLLNLLKNCYKFTDEILYRTGINRLTYFIIGIIIGLIILNLL